MSTLRSWQGVEPDDWTDAMRAEYAFDMTANLALGMVAVTHHLGAQNAINMMLAVMKSICAKHPAIVDHTLDVALDWCNDVSKLVSGEGRTVN